MNDFHRTNMGHRFFEGTMPALVEQLTKLNKNIEKLIAIMQDEVQPNDGPPPARPDTC